MKTHLMTVHMTFILKRTWMAGFCFLAIGITALVLNSPAVKTYQS